jgi:glycosyltransferase involved in cell wall biosynthesis
MIYFMISQPWHFVFLLPTRFPTDKAYGVTTEFTALALKNLNFKVTISTSLFDESLSTKLSVSATTSHLANKLLSRKIRVALTARFSVFLFIFAIHNAFKFKGKHVVFWTRDIFLAFLVMKFTRNFIVCEIHRTPGKLQSIFLKFLLKKKRVIVSPISNFLPSIQKSSKYKTIFSPMSVNSGEIEFFNSFKNRKRKTIIYVGNKSSGNYVLNVNLLNEVALSLNETHPEWNIEIIGVSESFFHSQIERHISPNIKLLGQIPRDLVIKRLALASIGLVIYPNSKWLNDSSPIKIIEYAAAGAAIVASKSVAHLRLLNDQKCVFFEIDSVKSLIGAIERLILDSSLRSLVSHNASNWSKIFTYDNRAQNILRELDSRLNNRIADPESI